MADIIKLLPDHVANQIAAGEVVQRPASVVKELLENAIDASASDIKLIIKDGGRTLVQVVDDGIGMTQTDARLSFERHATSKIASAEDLFNLHTKGFRGEALASIAAISHVELLSKTAATEVGTHIKIEASEVIAQEVVATPKGTSIAVKNLFFNIPARRNFLKSDQVELRHIIDEFQRVALAHPQVAFKMYNNGAEYFNLPKEGLKQRIVHIFGGKMKERLVPVTEETEVVTVTGFVCKPQFSKKSRGEQFFFTNHRFVKSPYLHHAVVSAFEGLLKPETYPGYFLSLAVDPRSIDINIHPTKTEVKFDDEHTLYAILRAAVKHSLGQFHIAPILDFERDQNLDTPYQYKDKAAKSPTITVDADFNPFQEGGGSKTTRTDRPKQNVTNWQNLYDFGDTVLPDVDLLKVESDAETPEVFENTEEPLMLQQATFQMQRKYVVSTVKSGLLVINQNRAHQRILFERFLTEITVKKGIVQQLLFPKNLDFTAAEIVILRSLQEELSSLGFDLVFGSDKRLTVNGAPNGIPEGKIATVLEDLLAQYTPEKKPDEHLSQTEWLSKTLCESLAIKTGQQLSPEMQTALVNDLFACKEPKLSPFQKTIYVILGENEIANKF